MTSGAAEPSAAPSPTASVSQTAPALVSTPQAIAAIVDACDLPGVAGALGDGDDAGVIAAMGGATALREAVLSGSAPCIDLSDPTHVWMVVDKSRPYHPLDFAPAQLTRVKDMRVLNEGILRTDVGVALTELVAAARIDGAGQIAITSGYRSYANQRTEYAGQVASKGRKAADAVSARPGFSEHQSGLAADVVACAKGGCSSIEKLGSTAQGRWLAANAWRYGFVVRYERGQTGTTGYSPEPWHIRYVGVALARAYHEGGFHTLEEFWGLPASPDYGD